MLIRNTILCAKFILFSELHSILLSLICNVHSDMPQILKHCLNVFLQI